MTSEQSKKHILIVEDDPSLCRLLQFGLNKAGYRTTTANHGRDAVTTILREPVDLVTVDLMMPIMDGLHFLRWLRQEAKVDMPALVFTSCDFKDSAEVLAAGATNLIRKPLRLPAVLDEVERLLTPACHA